MFVLPTEKPEEGISPDGYIFDQDCFSSVRYRTMPAHINGCGWIAAYNLRHYLGHDVSWEEVRLEMDAMHLPIPGPTLMRVMRSYLSKYVPGYLETAGRDAAIKAACASRAGIFRYTEGMEPHFICYISRPDGQFRFFNVSDALEDDVLPMEQFGEEHFLRGAVIAFTV